MVVNTLRTIVGKLFYPVSKDEFTGTTLEIIDDENSQCILTKLNALEQLTANTIVQHHPEELTYKDIAHRSNLKVSQVKRACKELEKKGLIVKMWKESMFDNDRRVIIPHDDLMSAL